MTNSIQSTPIPLTLRKELSDQMIPWKISDRIFKEMQSLGNKVPYKKVEVLPTDPEWQFVIESFLHDKPTRYDLKRIHCIHERHQMQAFEFNLSSIEREADQFKPNWNLEPQADQRAQTIERWKKATNLLSPFQTIDTDQRRRTWKKTKVLPLWHGSTSAICDSICTSGFTFFGKTSLTSNKSGDPKSTDDGYFGSGIYFTTSSGYAAEIYSGGHLMLAWVSMREPFPVVGDPQQSDMKTLRGKGAYKHYNAHFVPVQLTNGKHYPCQKGVTPLFDEIVVFQRNQTLPRFWVELAVSLPHLMSPSQPPDFVEDLTPIILNLLQNPNVQKDKKLRNFLGANLTPLLKMKGDDDLTSEHRNLFKQFTNLLDQSGKVNRSVRDFLTQRTVKQPVATTSKVEPSHKTSEADAVEKPKPTASMTGPYKVQATLSGHQKAVRTLLESEGILFSGDRGHELKMWDLTTQKCLKTISHEREISALYKDSDGNILSGSAGGIVRIFNSKTGDCIGQFKHGDGYVNSITQTSSGHYVTGGGDAQTKIWDQATRKLIKSFPGLGGYLELSPNQIAFTTGRTGKPGDEPRVVICNQAGKQLRALRGHQNIIYKLIKLFDDKLATSSADGSIRIWDPNSGQCLQIFQMEGRINCLVEISNDLIAATGQFPGISIWSRSTGKIVEKTEWVHANSIMSLIKLENGDFISGSLDKTIKILRRTAI